MSVETEIKIRLSDSELRHFREFLDSIHAPVLAERAAESNWLFDYPDQRLSQNGTTIRLRSYGGKSIVTYKGPLIEDAKFKKRPEFQTVVQDGDAMYQILSCLGLSPSFEYHKVRELRSWKLPEGLLEIALDETPVGIFAELEGPPAAIERATAEMGWGPKRYNREGYVELYAKAGLGAVEKPRSGPKQ